MASRRSEFSLNSTILDYRKAMTTTRLRSCRKKIQPQITDECGHKAQYISKSKEQLAYERGQTTEIEGTSLLSNKMDTARAVNMRVFFSNSVQARYRDKLIDNSNQRLL
ncbi:hypothetical protein CIPAW_03G242200 [Carya illinoinensis]|uniref:Uncharacterized protein n=1 Tax=Carya illinoinensis TaxID=32201 RepID=A0A8T1R5L5_CARIL|nr:hypothetical protein CIPAW_03G242200 [Carya illinoinensis]